MTYTAAAIESLLAKKKMRRNQLAASIGVNPSTITRALQGARHLDFGTLIKIASAMSTDPGERAGLITARLRDELGSVDSATLKVLRLDR